jgi:hypothetical protein
VLPTLEILKTALKICIADLSGNYQRQVTGHRWKFDRTGRVVFHSRRAGKDDLQIDLKGDGCMVVVQFVGLSRPRMQLAKIAQVPSFSRPKSRGCAWVHPGDLGRCLQGAVDDPVDAEAGKIGFEKGFSMVKTCFDLGLLPRFFLIGLIEDTGGARSFNRAIIFSSLRRDVIALLLQMSPQGR